MASKVRSGRGRSRDGAVSVSGPNVDRDGLPNVSVGISAAQSAASRHTDDGTWYVRLAGKGHYAVERRGRSIYVTALSGATA